MVCVVCVCVVGASGPGRGSKATHSVERFSQITSASGRQRGMLIHSASLLYFSITCLELAYSRSSVILWYVNKMWALKSPAAAGFNVFSVLNFRDLQSWCEAFEVKS